MPFDPKSYLAEKQTELAGPATGDEKAFDPKSYLASKNLDTAPLQLNAPRPATEINPGPAQSFLDMAMPLTRYAEAFGLKAGGQVNSISEGLDVANKAAEKVKSESPVASTIASGAGLLAGGLASTVAMDVAQPFIRAGIAKLTANETVSAATTGLADLAGLSLEGGSISVLNDQPKSFEDALHSFSTGATIAGALGLGVKGIAASARGIKNTAGNALEELDNKLTNAAKAKQQVEIEQAQKSFNLKNTQANRQQELFNQRQIELELTKSQSDRTKALIEQEPFINDRVATLPNKINDLIDLHLNEIGAKKSNIVQQIGNQRVNPTTHFKTALDSLDKISSPTPGAESSKQTAIKFIQNLDQRLFDQISPTDSLVGINKSRDTNISTLDKMHDQLQELLYDRGFLEGAPKNSQIRKTVQSFERNIREQINQADPTGELAVYNNAYHNLKNAKELDSLTLDSPRFFMQKATDPNNPVLLKRWAEFENNLKPEIEGGNLTPPKQADINPVVSQNFKDKNNTDFANKLGTAIFDQRLKASRSQFSSSKNAFNEINNKFKALRDIIQAEAEPAMLDYKVLQEHKPKLSALENKILNLETAIENNKTSIESRNLSAENAKIQVQDKLDETPKNALEALLPAKLRAALHFKRSVDDNGVLVNQVKDSIMNSMLTKGALQTGRAGVRGAITRLPSALGYTKLNSSESDRALKEIK